MEEVPALWSANGKEVARSEPGRPAAGSQPGDPAGCSFDWVLSLGYNPPVAFRLTPPASRLLETR